jgi:hypothetical protein
MSPWEFQLYQLSLIFNTSALLFQEMVLNLSLLYMYM